jgi:hypothetical protein
MFVLAVSTETKATQQFLKGESEGRENFPARFSPYLSVAFNLYL